MRRYAEIFARYEPVFKVFPAASESDRAVATGSVRWAERNLARVRAKISTTSLPPRQLDPLIGEMLACTERTQHVAGLLRAAAPDHWSERRVGDALTDVFHRALFGLDPDVNVHPPARRRPPRLRFDPQMRELFDGEGSADELTPAGRQTLADAHGRRRRGVRPARATTRPGSTTSSAPPASPTAPSTATSTTRSTWPGCSPPGR